MLRRKIIQLSSSLGIDCVHFFDQGQSVARNGSALAPRKLVKSLCIVYSVSERLSGSIIIRLLARPYQELNGLFLYPSTYLIYILASCTTSFSVYVSLSKNSRLCLEPNFSAKADAKVRLIFHPTKLFENYFSKK